MLRLRELRTQKGLEQKDIAVLLNIGKGTISNWEVGRTEPSIEYLTKLAKYFEVSIDYLTGNSDEMGIIEIASSLSNDEQELINLYRKLSFGDKNQLLGFAKGLVY